eukprot:CAMPEP_0202770122 /NCGR_PEP_ID=MMETSP1388-20130828/38191_1 /ASSEMBLY_ACC=CAM_ASM_000864 /TAXON_ID=37098 /ORGANISM="Isochrysis sp, Strain CCMP1244" /LENGTH=45 /DNA_ID= /DNA_START= /DNA_END= /DNA_ORIENTATION=
MVAPQERARDAKLVAQRRPWLQSVSQAVAQHHRLRHELMSQLVVG